LGTGLQNSNILYEEEKDTFCVKVL